MIESDDVEIIASTFLELSSEQRLKILMRLNQDKTKMSTLAKEFDATAPEIHRNITRLTKIGFVEKDVDGDYKLTSSGKTLFSQIPSLMIFNKKNGYFKNHSVSVLPKKFVQRIGALNDTTVINGYLKVMECWKDIYQNSEKYIHNVLIEVSYSPDLIKILSNKLKNNVKIKSIFSESAIVTKERKSVIDQPFFKKLIMDESIKRKMTKNNSISVILNENESGICFPSIHGEIDMSKMLYGKSPLFHEWCTDFFDYLWSLSNNFQESKLK